jgi:hypothetical protein
MRKRVPDLGTPAANSFISLRILRASSSAFGHVAASAYIAHDRLGVALPQVYPLLAELDPQAIHRAVRLAYGGALAWHPRGLHVHFRLQFDLVLADEVVRVAFPQFRWSSSLFAKQRKEEGDAYQCIAAVVQFAQDHAAVAFAADGGIHLASSVPPRSPRPPRWRGAFLPWRSATSSRARVLLRLLTVSPGRMRQHVIRAGHQRVLLAEELPSSHQRNRSTSGSTAIPKWALCFTNRVAQVLQMLGQRLRVVRELDPFGVAVDLHTSEHPSAVSSAGTTVPPTEFTASTTTRNLALMASTSTRSRRGWHQCACVVQPDLAP